MTGSPSLVLFDVEMSLFKLFSSDRSGATRNPGSVAPSSVAQEDTRFPSDVLSSVLRSQVDTFFLLPSVF